MILQLLLTSKQMFPIAVKKILILSIQSAPWTQRCITWANAKNSQIHLSFHRRWWITSSSAFHTVFTSTKTNLKNLQKQFNVLYHITAAPECSAGGRGFKPQTRPTLRDWHKPWAPMHKLPTKTGSEGFSWQTKEIHQKKFKIRRRQLRLNRFQSTVRNENREGLSYEHSIGLNLVPEVRTENNNYEILQKVNKNTCKTELKEYEQLIPSSATRPLC